MGGESIAPNLKVVLSQRLVRQTCFDCLEEYDAKDELIHLLGGNYLDCEVILHRAKIGNKLCRHCGGLGYRGRFLLLEYWGLGQEERQMILNDVEDHDAYVEAAMRHGFKPMVYLAMEALLSGATDLAEIIRSAITEEEFLRRGKEISRGLKRHLTAERRRVMLIRERQIHLLTLVSRYCDSLSFLIRYKTSLMENLGLSDDDPLVEVLKNDFNYSQWYESKHKVLVDEIDGLILEESDYFNDQL